MDERPREEQEARNSPRAVAAALVLGLIVLAVAAIFIAVLLSRACA